MWRQATAEEIWVTVAPRWHSCCLATGNKCLKFNGCRWNGRVLHGSGRIEPARVFTVACFNQNSHCERFVFCCGVNSPPPPPPLPPRPPLAEVYLKTWELQKQWDVKVLPSGRRSNLWLKSWLPEHGQGHMIACLAAMTSVALIFHPFLG